MTATWDMITSGDSAGQLIRPLQYTATDDDATRVRVYLKLATPLGSYKLSTDEGLDYATILSPLSSDEYRAALVREIVLADDGVDSIKSGPTVTIDGTSVEIEVTCITTTGAELTIGT